jgi:hypothetical protein
MALPDIPAVKRALKVAQKTAKKIDPQLGAVPLPDPGKPVPVKHMNIPGFTDGGKAGRRAMMIAKADGGGITRRVTGYHASPHKFDRFDVGKIGTGLRQQVYGHGLYFAGDKDTADAYRKKLDVPYDQAHTYRAGLNVDPDHMLDWGEPLHRQHPHVQAALADLHRYFDPEGGVYEGHTPGAMVYNQLVGKYGGPEGASRALHQAGVPGIKYKDFSQRGVPLEQRANNYVMFHHDPIDVEDRFKDGGEVEGFASGGAPQMPRQLSPMGLYSHAAEAAAALPQAKGTGQQMLASLKGVKPDELKWSGAQELASKPTITRDELVQHFRDRMPKIKESVLTNDYEGYEHPRQPRFEDYTMPGGRNYREHLFKLSSGDDMGIHPDVMMEHGPRLAELNSERRALNNEWSRSEGEDQRPIFQRLMDKTRERDAHEQMMIQKSLEKSPPYERTPFVHGHWPQDENVAVHMRTKERDLPEGGTALHLEELQSDWGQRGRAHGFRAPDGEKLPSYSDYVKDLEERARLHTLQRLQQQRTDQGREPDPNMDENLAHRFVRSMGHTDLAEHMGETDLFNRVIEQHHGNSMPHEAPYVTNTQNWTDLGLKQALRIAAEQGHNKLLWTPGEEQADRYDMRKHIGAISAQPSEDYDGKISWQAHHPETGDIVHQGDSLPGELDGIFGKEIADRIRSGVVMPHQKITYRAIHNLSGNTGPEHDTYEDVASRLHQYPEASQPYLRIEQVVRPHPGKGIHLAGLDLKTGGEGHIGYYNKILPKSLLALAKQHDPDAQLGMHSVNDLGGEDADSHLEIANNHQHLLDTQEMSDADRRDYQESVAMHRKLAGRHQLPGLTLTPRMRESILKNGFKAYKRGGDVEA